MDKSKQDILRFTKEPITIKELKEKTGLKWANLSKHLKDLRADSLIMDLGREGKSRVVQQNSFKVQEYIDKEMSEYNSIMR